MMLTMSQAAAEGALQQLAEQFTHWRQSRRTPRGPRIPETLWAEAVRLAHVLPRSQVAKALELKPHALKRRCATVEGVSPPASAAPHFVEVAAPWRTATTEVEIQRGDGARLRITYRDAAPTLVPLLQTFLESR
jgi:hypothetical protein